MRSVERLEWLGSERIAVSGSVNPSSTEYVVIDASTGTVEGEFVDDGFGAAFSPDGALRAYITGAPHFSRKEERSAKLIVNGAEIVNFSDQELEVAGQPRWSPDSSALAVPMVRQTPSINLSKVATVDQGSLLLVWDRHSGRSLTVDLPWGGAKQYSLSWQDSSIVVQAKSGDSTQQVGTKPGQLPTAREAWQLSDATGAERVGTWRRIDKAAAEIARTRASGLKSELQKELQRMGAAEIDIWCQTCELTLLPRSRGAAE